MRAFDNIKRTTLWLAATVVVLSPSANAQPIANRLLPSPRNAGFRMEGYLVWGGSIIKAGGKYHLFASRWPEGTGNEHSLLRGYREHSEVVRAVADDPIGPYEFQEVVLDGRGGDWWDGKMCHNPKIVRVDDTFVLYYIGSAESSPLRKVGYAWSKASRESAYGTDDTTRNCEPSSNRSLSSTTTPMNSSCRPSSCAASAITKFPKAGRSDLCQIRGNEKRWMKPGIRRRGSGANWQTRTSFVVLSSPSRNQPGHWKSSRAGESTQYSPQKTLNTPSSC